MSYDGWLEYNETVLVNVARTVALSRAMGVDIVRVDPTKVAWIAGVAPGDPDYADITTAPWYDAQYPASEEFAGFIPLSLTGLDDSTLESSTVEYITDGGTTAKTRNATLSLVANFALIAKTERGAEYGKRWLDRTLRGSGPKQYACSGVDLRYSRWMGADAPVVHRRDVRLTRGTSVTSKRRSACAALWMVTFTLTAADPYEYGEPDQKITDMGGAVTTGPGVTSSGSLDLTETPCAQYDYSPIYDPLHPALLTPPAPPDFLPDGWTLTAGDAFTRKWARISPAEPSSLNTVPVIHLTTTTEARMVRVSVWPAASAVDDQCDPLFSAVVSYLPANVDFYIDGEQKTSYVFNGGFARRTDSLVYASDANPVQWPAFNDHDGLLVTLDVFGGATTVRAALAMVPKSD